MLICVSAVVRVGFQGASVERFLDVSLAVVLVRVEPEGLQMCPAKRVVIPLATRLYAWAKSCVVIVSAIAVSPSLTVVFVALCKVLVPVPLGLVSPGILSAGLPCILA